MALGPVIPEIPVFYDRAPLWGTVPHALGSK
jgi:hypothetical protein